MNQVSYFCQQSDLRGREGGEGINQADQDEGNRIVSQHMNGGGPHART